MNYVVSGDYRRRLIFALRGAVMIVPPLLRPLRLTPATVQSWRPVEGKPRLVEVTFTGGGRSVLSMGRRCFAAFRRALSGPGAGPADPSPYMPLIGWYWQSYRLPGGDYTVIDVETTGLDPCICEILEMGAIRFRSGRESARFQTYVRPTGRLNPDAQALNHITWDMVSSAPPLETALPRFLDFVGNDILMGYNVSFELKFLQTRSQTLIDNVTFDVLDLARRTVSAENYRLETLRRLFSLPGVPRTALGDCQSTSAAYVRCISSPTARDELALRAQLPDIPIRAFAD